MSKIRKSQALRARPTSFNQLGLINGPNFKNPGMGLMIVKDQNL